MVLLYLTKEERIPVNIPKITVIPTSIVGRMKYQIKATNESKFTIFEPPSKASDDLRFKSAFLTENCEKLTRMNIRDKFVELPNYARNPATIFNEGIGEFDPIISNPGTSKEDCINNPSSYPNYDTHAAFSLYLSQQGSLKVKVLCFFARNKAVFLEFNHSQKPLLTLDYDAFRTELQASTNDRSDRVAYLRIEGKKYVFQVQFEEDDQYLKFTHMIRVRMIKYRSPHPTFSALVEKYSDYYKSLFMSLDNLCSLAESCDLLFFK